MIAWTAECRDCLLHNATVVRRFPTHVERDLWRRAHMLAYPDHWVSVRAIAYDPDEYPEGPSE